MQAEKALRAFATALLCVAAGPVVFAIDAEAEGCETEPPQPPSAAIRATDAAAYSARDIQTDMITHPRRPAPAHAGSTAGSNSQPIATKSAAIEGTQHG